MYYTWRSNMKKRIQTFTHRQWNKEWNIASYCLLYFILGIAITIIWKYLDILETGQDMPSATNSVFSILLAISIILNVLMYRLIKLGKM